MKIDPNDPRWTAYVLDELDEKDRSAIELALAQSAEARRIVDEIRDAAGLLGRELKSEAASGLLPQQRARVLSRMSRRGLLPSMSWKWATAGVAAAACLALLIITANSVKEKQLAEMLPAAVPPVASQAAPPETLAVAPAPVRTPSPQGRREQASPSSANSVKQTAVLEGTLTDASGARIPGARVDATRQGAALTETTLTDASGRYRFQTLPPGSYEVTAQVQGFKAGRLDNIVLDKRNPTTADMTLGVGGLAESVMVSSASLPLNTDWRRRGMRIMPLNMQMMRSPATRRHADRVPDDTRGTDFNTEAYDYIGDNPFRDVLQNPLSTFSIDVDTASYSNVRRFLNDGALPPKDAVRIEELVNYFDYDYAGPKDSRPFAAHIEVSEAPWNPEHRLLRIALKGRDLDLAHRPASNLVFLIDVSGSMEPENKLPLIKESLRLLIEQLNERDKVAIVVYAGASGLALPATGGDQKQTIRAALDRLEAGGSTNGASGIALAYQTARESFIRGGVNRVILATDGDFNIGITNRGDLTRLIEREAKQGVFLSALGFGMGNYKDSTLEMLADKGDGNYAYIDSIHEARKALVEQMSSTLVTIAKDVKIQVEFNPREVQAYRLIGYENRVLRDEEFNDDTKDAGEIGAGHRVTALYELVPPGRSVPVARVDPLRYQSPKTLSSNAHSGQLLTLKVRHKASDGDRSLLSEFTVSDPGRPFSQASTDFKFAAAVAAFGMVLRESQHKGNATLENVLEWAKAGQGPDRNGYRHEFIGLIHRALSIRRP